ncbi:hypothetical protein [Streptomyces sp. S186]|uniref:hypothetical protein n=1 Tax=Streptomyces sp. S186 TaxID=3434395 RepID=UPI003F6713F5
MTVAASAGCALTLSVAMRCRPGWCPRRWRCCGPPTRNRPPAVSSAARQLGSVLGVAVFGTLTAGGLVPGVHFSGLLGAAGFLLAARWAPRAGRTPGPDA